ncbi:E3 ubiquitin ISG15 ligase TRIM25-like [Pelobates cultripes]|uniref:E3 ubiquitin ISG15 ligase TRIM25-like n=1 Tax=Pelobates cultripes TaxID=61616 RepID=A0AAD1R7F0_PELCU|nr:E3 ubiquitin ISG15 ligase TRIM25-like [Pelobates cultripes]
MESAGLRSQLTCYLCLNIYTDPVTLMCGHSFCQVCITTTWANQTGKEYSECAECGQQFCRKTVLKRNLRLCNIAKSFQAIHSEHTENVISCTYCDSHVSAAKTCLMCEASLCLSHLSVHTKSTEHILTEPTIALENLKCSDHWGVLSHYCSTDSVYICRYCITSGGHRGHQVETLTVAFNKKKQKLKIIQEKLKSKREEANKRIQGLQEHRRKVRGVAADVRERVSVMIVDIRKKLDVLERRVLGEISRQEEEISLRISELIQQLKIKVEELSTKRLDIEELFLITDPYIALQRSADYCDTAEEGDNEDTETDVNCHDLGDLNLGLISVTLHSGLSDIAAGIKGLHHIQDVSHILTDTKITADILQDINTASNYVTLSSVLKTVSVSLINQNCPETQERFQYPQVLSTNSYSSGQHCWEVEGSKSGIWTVGMTYHSIKGNGCHSRIGDNTKYWGLWKWNNDQYFVRHDSKPIRLPYRYSCHRLGIYLNYETGQLSFYELGDVIKHLYTFTDTFTEPLQAVFGVWDYSFLPVKGKIHENTWIRIRS